MSTNMQELVERAAAVLDELNTIEATFGSDRASWPAGQVERYERQRAHAARLEAEIEAAQSREERVERVRQAAADPRNVEAAVEPYAGTGRRGDPWAGLTAERTLDESPSGYVARAHDMIGVVRGLSPEGRSQLADAVDHHGGTAARMLLARANPSYLSAFEKVCRNPERGAWTLTAAERDAMEQVEAARASLSTNTNSGGYLIPLSLDASYLSLTNVGIASAIRRIARVETAISSPHRVLASAGVTAQWLAEGSAVSDASPTFSNIDVALYKTAAYVTASEELVADSTGNLMAFLPQLMGDARDRLEGAAFVTGSGSGAPYGIVTQVTAVTASRVSPTTGGAFAAASEVYKVFDALTPRARQSANLAWVANNSTISAIRKFDTYGGGNFIASLADPVPTRLLGAPIFEASAMDSAVTTGSNILLAGDFQQFVVVDHVAGDSLEYVPVVVDTNGMPLYQRGWKLNHRVGSATTNVDAFRVMRL